MTSPPESTYTDLKHEEFDPYQSEDKPVPPRNFRLAKGALFSHLLGWPALAVLGQLFLQALAWTFLAVVRSRGSVALPLSRAIWADNNPHIVTFVATLISTFLAASSSFLFSYALRRSMSLYLLRPVSLATLGAGVTISTRSLVFHRRHWKWPAVSLLCLIMAGIQTSAWSTLITPVHIVISSPLLGRDFDLSNPSLQQLWNAQDSLIGGSCNVAETGTAIAGGVPDSGYANAQSYLGLPAAVSLLGQGFNVSTRGIFAATLNDSNVGGWSIPATVESVVPRHSGISSSYSMNQQGFTATVSCELRNLTNVTSPDVESLSSFPTGWEGPGADESGDESGDGPTMTWMQISSSCKQVYGMNQTEIIVGEESPYMWVLVCDPTPDSPNNYTMILQHNTDLTPPSNASYLVCRVAPTTSAVRVNYAGEISVTVESLGPPVDAGGIAGSNAMSMVVNLVVAEQSLVGNGMANQLLELTANGGANEEIEILEQYLQGVVEYSASVLRTCLHNSSAFPDGVPTNMTQLMNGTWNAQTLGWKRYSTGTTIWIIVPGLFMACCTVALVLVAIYRHGGEMDTDTTTFDPSNPLHLMAAAAAGGLNNVFRSLRGRDILDGGKTTVVLGSVPGRGPALFWLW
ncbi:hypothetical protein C8R47DRAFT_1327535 [Mycena vitilis]|nr:hypothetical protein C8R47DRAFT_1327535 [Mycena vitilis]